MATLRSITTTVLDPPMLRSTELISFKNWSLNLYPEYKRIAKTDALPIEDLIALKIRNGLLAQLKLTEAAFAALSSDEEKLKQISRVVNPFSEPSAALLAIKKIKMKESGHMLDNYFQYVDEFKWLIKIVTADPLPGRFASNPTTRNVVAAFVDGAPDKLMEKVIAFLTPTSTFDDMETLMVDNVIKIAGAESFLGIKAESKSKSDSETDGRSESKSDKPNAVKCSRCGKSHNVKTCRLPLSTVCNKCGKEGHLASVCRSGTTPSTSKPNVAPQKAPGTYSTPKPSPSVPPRPAPTTPGAKPTHVRWSAESVVTSLVDKSSAEEASEALAKEIKEMQIRHEAALAELKASKAIIAEHLINLGAINLSSGGNPLESPAPERVPLQEVALVSEDSTQEIVLGVAAVSLSPVFWPLSRRSR